MDTNGSIKSIEVPFRSNKAVISLEVTAPPEEVEKYKDMPLDIKIVKHRNKRSLNANALLWECIGNIAHELTIDPWEVYLSALEKYGKYTYIEVMPNAVEALKRQWREIREVGETEYGNVEMICYFGSSTYDSKEFSTLLDGVISDMKDLGLDLPTSEDMKKAIENITQGS